MERQVGFHCSLALQQWLRAHLQLHVTGIRRGLAGGQGGGMSEQQAKQVCIEANKPPRNIYYFI